METERWLMFGTAKAVFDFVCQYKAKHDGLSPARHEIAAALHMNPRTAGYHLTMLEIHGYLKAHRRNNRVAGYMVTGGQYLTPAAVQLLEEKIP